MVSTTTRSIAFWGCIWHPFHRLGSAGATNRAATRLPNSVAPRALAHPPWSQDCGAQPNTSEHPPIDARPFRKCPKQSPERCSVTSKRSSLLARLVCCMALALRAVDSFGLHEHDFFSKLDPTGRLAQQHRKTTGKPTIETCAKPERTNKVQIARCNIDDVIWLPNARG